MPDVYQNFADMKLFMDVYGVTHWRYTMRGLIFLCGYDQVYMGSFEPEHVGFPTCIRCVAITDRGPWPSS